MSMFSMITHQIYASNIITMTTLTTLTTMVPKVESSRLRQLSPDLPNRPPWKFFFTSSSPLFSMKRSPPLPPLSDSKDFVPVFLLSPARPHGAPRARNSTTKSSISSALAPGISAPHCSNSLSGSRPHGQDDFRAHHRSRGAR